MNRVHASCKSTLIIAEAGVNHNGSLDMALQLVDAAKYAGADVVKFQTFKAKNIASQKAQKAEYQQRNTKENSSQYEMLQALELSDEMHRAILQRCNEIDIEFLSTPFDEESVDYLHTLGISRMKIPSGEITNAPLILKIARTGLPIILSTGMSTMEEIEDALSVIAFGYADSDIQPSRGMFREALHNQELRNILQQRVTILHCTTEYPTPLEEVNLRAMQSIGARFNLQFGYSDHTEGVLVPALAVACGACVVEKHFTMDKSLPGPDHKASLTPDQLKIMVQQIRDTEISLGCVDKQATLSELKNISVVRKSLVASRDIRLGEAFSSENVSIKRPGTGISPFEYWNVLGEIASHPFKKDDLIQR